jgi:quinoprotein glucose dehydrogenase
MDDSWHQRFGIHGSDAPRPARDDDDDDDDDPQLDHALIWRRAMNAAYRIGSPERARSLAWFARRDGIDHDLRAEAVDILGVWGQPEPLDRLTGYSWPLPARDDAFVLDLAVALSDVAERETPDEVLTAWARLARGLAVGGSKAQNDAARQTLQALPEELMVRLASIVSNQEFGVEARIAALEALEVMEPPNLKDIVAGAFDARDPELRAAALSALEGLSLADAMPRLPALLAMGEMPEQRMALRILREADDPRAEEWVANELRRLASGAYPAELVLDLVLAAEARTSPAVDLLLARHNERFGADPILDPWLDGIFGGDASAGRDVFERTQMQCVRCHEAPEGTTSVGPDLTGVGGRLSRLQILESILTPNRRTSPGYGSSKLVLADGSVISGRVIDEEIDDAGVTTLRLQDSEGNVTEIDAATVVDRQPGISAMPEGLAAGLTREEMRDLIEYVVSL